MTLQTPSNSSEKPGCPSLDDLQYDVDHIYQLIGLAHDHLEEMSLIEPLHIGVRNRIDALLAVSLDLIGRHIQHLETLNTTREERAAIRSARGGSLNMTNATQTKPDLKTLPEIRDMALELEGLAQALDIIMQENETPGRRLACCTLAEVVMTRSEAVSRALDEFTSNGGG